MGTANAKPKVLLKAIRPGLVHAVTPGGRLLASACWCEPMHRYEIVRAINGEPCEYVIAMASNQAERSRKLRREAEMYRDELFEGDAL